VFARKRGKDTGSIHVHRLEFKNVIEIVKYGTEQLV